MSGPTTRIGVAVVFLVGCASSFAIGRAQAPAPGRQLTNPTRGGLRMLLDQERLGGPQVAAGERSYPANYESAEHTHESIEVIYVLSGEYRHIINGQTHILTTGMLGYVKPGDKVKHKTGPTGPARTLMIWVPGGDGERLAADWRSQ